MTDPNLERPAETPHTTIVNNAPAQRSGGGGMGLIIGIIVVALIALVAWFALSRGVPQTRDMDVDVKIEAPKLPDAPKLPNIEPPSVPTPTPAPAPEG